MMNKDFMNELFVKTKVNMSNQILENFFKEFTKQMIKNTDTNVLKKSFEQARENCKTKYIKSFEPFKHFSESLGEHGEKAMNSCFQLYDETINSETLNDIFKIKLEE